MVSVTVSGTLPSGVSKRSITDLVNEAYAVAKARGAAAFAVSVVGDRKIRSLNRQYRDRDAVTDVLSFGYDEGEGEYDVNEDGELVRQLGDLVICLPQVKRQAKRIGRTVRAEFALMVVHGTLHLLGYDHETMAQERRMFGLQHEVLRRRGIS